MPLEDRRRSRPAHQRHPGRLRDAEGSRRRRSGVPPVRCGHGAGQTSEDASSVRWRSTSPTPAYVAVERRRCSRDIRSPRRRLRRTFLLPVALQRSVAYRLRRIVHTFCASISRSDNNGCRISEM